MLRAARAATRAPVSVASLMPVHGDAVSRDRPRGFDDT